jgi:hypothetical protein
VVRGVETGRLRPIEKQEKEDIRVEEKGGKGIWM